MTAHSLVACRGSVALITQEYRTNRAQFPRAELARYEGSWVAFSADGCRIVASGEALLAPSVTRAVIAESPVNHFPRLLPRKAAVAELTPRKGEVLDLPARGLSNPEIYERLEASSRPARTR